MSSIKIENVRVLDPIQNTDSMQTVFIENGKLVAASDRSVKPLMVKESG